MPVRVDELATRTALIVAVPGPHSRGLSTAALVEVADLFPTLVDLCGLPLMPRWFARIEGLPRRHAALMSFVPPDLAGGPLLLPLRGLQHSGTTWKGELLMNSESVSGLTGKELLICKPEMTLPCYEFRHGEKCVGKLVFPKACGTLAEVEILGREWTFKRIGFWRPMITIRTAGSATDLLRIPLSGLWSGMLVVSMADGRLYELRTTGLWNPKRTWVRDQRTLVEFGKCSGLRKYAVVRILEDEPEIPLLITLGAYCLVMQDQDDAAAIAASTAIMS